MQCRKDFAGKQILLISQHLRTGVSVIAQERIYKSTLSGRGFQKTFHLNAGIFQRVGYGINYTVVGIECRQHRGFERIHITGKLPVIL